ncbi:ABC1 family protein [Capsaspora owczarzaki ATCC 30864]|uniref:ABC1 family protein n=1 Tax=Capsaspora owczarzaki (strain ATCC 30864) TaxID=595528 RepID=A0A0D2UBN9_CAPO3|nr:ABC1 family protein [Capsaspora owczarzaki ATCC 30864]
MRRINGRGARRALQLSSKPLRTIAAQPPALLRPSLALHSMASSSSSSRSRRPCIAVHLPPSTAHVLAANSSVRRSFTTTTAAGSSSSADGDASKPPRPARLLLSRIAGALVVGGVVGLLGLSYNEWRAQIAAAQNYSAPTSSETSTHPPRSNNQPSNGTSLLAPAVAPQEVLDPAETFLQHLQYKTKALERFVLAQYTFARIAADYKWSLRGLESGSVQYRAVRSQVHQRSADRLLWLCRRLKGFYTKAGQHIASLNYAVPQEFTSTLSVLQDMAPFDSIETVRATIARELKCQLEEVFSEFDEVPVAAASLAQVHRAVERQSGKVVAVKVQHPHLDHDFASDIWSMRQVAALTAFFFDGVQLSWIVDELEKALTQELDFLHEGRNAERVAANFEKRHETVKVPGILWHLTSRRILSMEFVSGVKVNDRQALLAAGLDPAIVSRYLAETFGEMIFVHSYVHCDLHPGNVLVRWWPPLPGDDALMQDASLKSAQARATAKAASAAKVSERALEQPPPSSHGASDASKPDATATPPQPRQSDKITGFPMAQPKLAASLPQRVWNAVADWAWHYWPLRTLSPFELEEQRHRKAGSKLQLVLLDHGLYRELDNDFRLNYCKLWKALVTVDDRLLKEASTALGAGEYANFFPLIFTFRAWSSKGVVGQSMSADERRELRQKLSGLTFTNVVEFFETLPRDMLLVMRTNNLVRSINQDLGGSSLERFSILARSGMVGLYYDGPIGLDGRPQPIRRHLAARIQRSISHQFDLAMLWFELLTARIIMFWFQDPDRERL